MDPADSIVGFYWDRRKLTQQVWFSVDWDPEHGADVEFDADGNLIEPWNPTADAEDDVEFDDDQ